MLHILRCTEVEPQGSFSYELAQIIFKAYIHTHLKVL